MVAEHDDLQSRRLQTALHSVHCDALSLSVLDTPKSECVDALRQFTGAGVDDAGVAQSPFDGHASGRVDRSGEKAPGDGRYEVGVEQMYASSSSTRWRSRRQGQA